MVIFLKIKITKLYTNTFNNTVIKKFIALLLVT